MHVDAVIKRSFVPLVALLVGVAAYFQARGLGELVAAVVAGDRASAPEPRRRAPRSALAALDAEPSLDAVAILARNPFDSVTGPLLGRPPEPPPSDDGGDLAAAPPCATAHVVLIAASDDAGWSFAAIAEVGRPPILRRVGDEFAGYFVAAIGRDRVWLTAGPGARAAGSCAAGLGAAKAAAGAAQAADAVEPRPRTGKPGRGALPPELAARIRKTGENAYAIDRSALASILEQQAQLFGSVRIAPGQDGGGVRLTGVRPGSALAAVGIENGDRLQSINGVDLSDPRDAIAAYTRLSSASHLALSLVRKGAPMTIDVRVE